MGLENLVFSNYGVDLSFLKQGWTDIFWSRRLNLVLSDYRVDLIFPCYHSSKILSLSIQIHQNLDFIEDFFLKKKIKNIYAILWGYMTCMHPYLVWKIAHPSLMLHHHRVPLFAIQNLLSFSNSSAHSSLPYTSPPLKYKCSAHSVLFVMITSLIVYQVWSCP